jgi:hypothetical protein
VQGDAGVVGKRDASACRLDALAREQPEQRLIQRPPDAAAAASLVDVHGDVRRPPVAGAFTML